MKRVLVILVIIILCMSILGCVNKQQKIDELKSVASDFIDQGNYDEAITTYHKILDIKDDPEYRRELSSIENLKGINDLKEQADMYREKGNLDNTIELYEKILDIEEDETIRAELDDVKYEKESVEKTMEFLDLLKDINLIIPSGLRVTEEEMREIFMDLNKALELL